MPAFVPWGNPHRLSRAAVFKPGHYVATEIDRRVRVSEGSLAIISTAGKRMLRLMPKVREAPFWLDPIDQQRPRPNAAPGIP
jgi:hypothetical protein